MQTATQQFDRTFHQACLLLVLFCYVMPVWEGSNAYADPPPWAPAHGYRHKHHQGDEHDDDQDEEDGNQDRQREVYAVPYGIDRGTCNREELGRVLGGGARQGSCRLSHAANG